jgi:hypothetical protein
MKMHEKWGIRWRQVPWSLWAYVVLTIVGIVRTVFTFSGPVALLLFAALFILVWDYFLLRGVRWLWVATIVVFVFYSVIDLLNGTGTWFGEVLGLIELALLLLPPTRRFFGAGNSPPVVQDQQEG